MAHSCVKIDLIALRATLSREQHRGVDLKEVDTWLAQNGFTPNSGDWHCDGESVNRLRANQILGRRDLEDDGGIVFVLPK